MIRPIPIVIDDFRVLREKNLEYIDKTHLITELIDRDNIKVILLPRLASSETIRQITQFIHNKMVFRKAG